MVQKTAGGKDCSVKPSRSGDARRRDVLAVIGCHPVRARTPADIGELGRTSTDAPQTVLKTAGLASAAIHYRAPEFEDRAYESVNVRQCSVPVGPLAVFLAVIRDVEGPRLGIDFDNLSDSRGPKRSDSKRPTKPV